MLLSTHSLDPYLRRESDHPDLVHQPAYLSMWLAAPSHQRVMSINPGVQCGAYVGEVKEMMCVVCGGAAEGTS